MTRNFKTLEVGKYYISNEEPFNLVKIVDFKYPYFISESVSAYYPDGSSWDSKPSLTTEVTVTITPVKAKKYQEMWAIVNGTHEWFGLRFPSKEEAEDYLRKWYWGNKDCYPNTQYNAVLFREVLEKDYW